MTLASKHPEKKFNTAGPCKADKHYMVDPLKRIDHDI